jgi:hypothetical protein
VRAASRLKGAHCPHTPHLPLLFEKIPSLLNCVG